MFDPTENTPKEDFETKAKEQIPAGEASYSEVVAEGGKRYVQMAACLMRRAVLGAKPDEVLIPVLVRLRAFSPAPARSTKVTITAAA